VGLGVGVSVAVGAAVGVAVGSSVAVGSGVGVAVGAAVGVGVGVGAGLQAANTRAKATAMLSLRKSRCDNRFGFFMATTPHCGRLPSLLLGKLFQENLPDSKISWFRREVIIKYSCISIWNAIITLKVRIFVTITIPEIYVMTHS